MQPNEQDECAFFALPPILLALLFKFPDESHAKLFSIWTLVQGRNTHNAQEVVCVYAYLCVCVCSGLISKLVPLILALFLLIFSVSVQEVVFEVLSAPARS